MGRIKIMFLVMVATVFGACGPESDSKSKISKIEINKKLIIKPGGNEGQDVFIANHYPSDNRSFSDFLSVSCWTIFGQQMASRSLMKFDLPVGITNSKIDSALLVLHPYLPIKSGTFFTSNSGENRCFILRTLTPWKNDSVNWINQPNFTYTNGCLTPKIGGEDLSPVRLNITELVKDQIKEKDHQLGLLLKLRTEKVYSRVLFASSNYQESSKHPSLEIYYSVTE